MPAHWGIQVHHRQASLSSECYSSYRHWYQQVWSWFVSAVAHYAWCSTTSAAQTLHHHLPVSAEQSTSIFGGLLHSCLRYCQLSTSAISQLPPAVRATTLTFHVQPLGLLCCWTVGLELTARQSETWHVMSTAFGVTSRLFFPQATSIRTT